MKTILTLNREQIKEHLPHRETYAISGRNGSF